MNSIWIKRFSLTLIAILLLSVCKEFYQQKSPREQIIEFCEEYYSTGKRPAHIELPCH
ncbi:hypothetical protein J2X05_001178 [Cellvibrio fibrivorans]|jgi:hypothetical protein|uniref:Lipoprotein n=1 Tax=Cellvibrio fibrivorans TaxID=126350 RepID=A0ABU1UVF5_9GAMM|nr:hypothetical protein [Cellvibrio fibrivorans]